MPVATSRAEVSPPKLAIASAQPVDASLRASADEVGATTNNVLVKLSAPIRQNLSSSGPGRGVVLSAPSVTRTPTPSPTVRERYGIMGPLDGGPTSLPTRSAPIDAGPDDPQLPVGTPTVYITDVEGRFFYNPGGHPYFDIATQTSPAFVQQFPVLNFNPTAGVTCASTPINGDTRPLTDVNESPSCTPIPAQATAPPPTPTLQAGITPLAAFEAVFSSTIYVSQAADIEFNIEYDDGFIWGIGPLNGVAGGPQPEFRSGTFEPPPPSTATPWPTTTFRSYLVASQYVEGYGQGSVTIRFPAAGFYPIEMDYAENGDGGLNITLENPTGTPLSNGPSPTATATCYAPTAEPTYPWCPLSPTPASAPSPPAYTNSYYVRATNTPGPGATSTPTGWTGYWYTAGVKQADNMMTAGPNRGVVILDFGKPAFNYYDDQVPSNDLWGAKLVPTCQDCTSYYISAEDIETIVLAYAEGFSYEAQHSSSTHQPNIQLAIGTNNFLDTIHPPVLTPGQFRRHGQHWGAMINEVSSILANDSSWVTVQGADDIEFGWSDQEHTLSWAQGFAEVTRADQGHSAHYYYSYSDCADCYPPGDPNKTQLCAVEANWCWDIDAAVAAHWANPAALPLPQIYHAPPYADQSAQWAWLSSYSATHSICFPDYNVQSSGYPMLFLGITGSLPNLSPGTAWQDLWRAIPGYSCTSGYEDFLQYITTVDYFIHRGKRADSRERTEKRSREEIPRGRDNWRPGPPDPGSWCGSRAGDTTAHTLRAGLRRLVGHRNGDATPRANGPGDGDLGLPGWPASHCGGHSRCLANGQPLARLAPG